MREGSTPKLKGGARKFYIDSEANDLLNKASGDLGGIHISNIVCALIRAMSGVSPRQGEEPVYTQLKRVFGREQFIAFLKAVADAVPHEAKPSIKPEAGEDFIPDAWILGKTGILAFYNPSNDNVGAVFASASALKSKHSLQKVIVVAPLADIMPEDARSDMEAAGIFVVSLSSLDRTLGISKVDRLTGAVKRQQKPE